VLVSALVFAVAHGISIVLPAAFVLGVVNAVMLRRSGSVWPGVIAHAVNNALVFGLAAILL
jgi:membrane protease YdiL (CAAX protease family)